MQRIGKYWSKIEDILSLFIASAAVLVMMLSVTSNVIGRYLFHSPIAGAYELVGLLLVAGGMFSIPYVQRIRGHIGVEFVKERMSFNKGIAMDLIGLVFGLVVSVLLLWQSAIFAVGTWGAYSMGLVPIPYAPFRLSIPLGFGFITIRLGSQIFSDIVALRKHQGVQ